MMRKSVVVTDSAAQVPTEVIDKYGIEVIPLLISSIIRIIWMGLIFRTRVISEDAE